jgi:hypothetical protein
VNPITDAPAGAAFYALLKLFGYLAAIAFLKSRYQTQTNIYFAALFRTGVGVVLGVSYAAVAALFPYKFGWAQFFLAGLIPIRIFEWALLVFVFFDRHFYDDLRALKFIGLGVIWSFLIDVIALLLSLITFGGRFWVC